MRMKLNFKRGKCVESVSSPGYFSVYALEIKQCYTAVISVAHNLLKITKNLIP